MGHTKIQIASKARLLSFATAIGVLVLLANAQAADLACPEIEGATKTNSVEDLERVQRANIRSGAVMKPKQTIMHFYGVPAGRDVYNPAGHIRTRYNGKMETLLLARVESADSETDMYVGFFLKKGNDYIYLNDDPAIPHLGLQDPTVAELKTEHGKEILVGGVKVWAIGKDANGKDILNYATVFYRDEGKGISHLKEFFTGPDHMKDIRFVEDPDGFRDAGDGFDILTRPQDDDHAKGGRGQVGLLQVKSMSEITAEKIANAPILKNQFLPKQWGGANSAKYSGKHTIEVNGHYARYLDSSDKIRDYVTTAWFIDTRARLVYSPQVTVSRGDLTLSKDWPAKRDDLYRVTFPGKPELNADGTYTAPIGFGDKFTTLVTYSRPTPVLPSTPKKTE